MDTLTDTSKKSAIEDLSKEEIVKKYRALLNILQKAKQSKESLTEENNELKQSLEKLKNSTNSPDTATKELLDSLTQQKLNLTTSLDDIKHQNDILQNKLNDCECNVVSAENKVIELDTENQSYRRQVKRLTEENEQLLSDLDNLEKESNKLRDLGLFQQQQLLDLEKSNDNLIDCNVSLNNKNEVDEELLKENKELKSNMETLKTNCKNAEALINSLKNVIEEKNKQNEVYLNTTDDLNIELHKNKALVEKLQQDIVTMSNKLSNNQIVSSGVASDLENINEKLKDKVKLFHSKLVRFAGDVKLLKEQKSEILNNFKDYFLQVKLWETQLKDFSIKVINQFKELEEEKQQLKIENETLQSKLKTLETEILVLTNSSRDCIDDYTQTHANGDDIAALKRENSELLAEMNQMNQALKERGETISKQQEYCQELLKNIKTFESLPNLNELQAELEKKTKQIEELQIALRDEKSNPSQHSLDSSQDISYAESDTMSTSTVSRTEEMSRIKDLDGSWEERYGKLRNLALKLKGKIRDLTTDLTREQTEKMDLQQKLSSSSKTIQSLQSQCDHLQDELDTNRNQLKEGTRKLDSAALDISNNKKKLADTDELIVKLKSELEFLNKDKSNTETWKKQVSSKVQNLKKELEANALLKKDFECQIVKLTGQLEAKERELKDEIEKHNTTRTYLQESNNECKKQSVLNLEMQDYERSLKELTQKLERKQELVNKLKNQIDTQKSTMNALKEQNRLLEERVENEETELTNARSEIRTCKKSITEFEMLISQKDEKLQDLMRSLENCRVDNEDLSTQLSKLVAENQKAHDILKYEKDHLYSRNLGLEQKLLEVQENLKLREDELNVIRTEYQSYKVRAQSVLRQNQTRDVGLEERLSEEAASLRAQVAILTSEISELKNSLEKLKEANAKLETDVDEIEKKYANTVTVLEEQRDQYSALLRKHEKVLAEHAESMRDLKVHSETLGQCYRQQLSEQEVRHNREIIELQSKVDKAVPAVPDVPLIPPLSIPREQGEGSESNESTKMNMHPVPLDRLLSSESDHDVGFIKKQLSENETKVSHLTGLLAETEQDLAKHVQMNKLLKEEIRRHQRSVERERHAENLEYLKNVVFKFATLNSGDERSRLVPVLNTILKFSPDEISKLNVVAKGDIGGRGWSNYIPIWSSSTRPPQ